MDGGPLACRRSASGTVCNAERSTHCRGDLAADQLAHVVYLDNDLECASRVRGGLCFFTTASQGGRVLYLWRLTMPLCNSLQEDLDRDVALATGEDLSVIRTRGFSLLNPDADFDPEPDQLTPQIVDWDDLEQDRSADVACVPLTSFRWVG